MAKKNKPFFFRVDAADFLLAVSKIQEDKRGEWVFRLALDLVEADTETCESSFGRKIIEESNEYIAKKAASGRKGMEKRWGKKVVNISGE